MAEALSGVRIGLLTASASRLGGGVSEALVTHAAVLRELGADPQVFALEDAHGPQDRARYGDVPVSLAPVVGPARFGYAPTLLPRLRAAECDILHLHGIWMYPSLAGLSWARRTGKPYVVSPHGMLAPWILARGRVQKLVARLAYEGRAWRRADMLHALTPAEAEDIAQVSGRMDAVVVPNAAPAARALSTAPRGPTILYLGRIHPKKNLDSLIDAWEMLGERRPGDARLVIAGWGEERHLASLRQRLASASPSIHFVGPAYGADKERLMGEARFTILPSLSEGLPMTVLEGWATGTPAIMTGECNLAEGFAAGAAWRCGTRADAIAPLLEQALDLPHESWSAMARAAHGLAAGRFARSTVAAQWERVYARLMDNHATRQGAA